MSKSEFIDKQIKIDFLKEHVMKDIVPIVWDPYASVYDAIDLYNKIRAKMMLEMRWTAEENYGDTVHLTVIYRDDLKMLSGSFVRRDTFQAALSDAIFEVILSSLKSERRNEAKS